ncbi:hypothetical protein Q8F55_002716 [Vanrija albida]|uniref:BTB domain-containing protein n=1 Tax=Vanrija albida TaxID=181172 RepID=A0ABR3QAJ7_9TREE
MPKSPRKKAAARRAPAKKRKPTPPPPVIVDDETWTTGDFSLISSDDVRFRVDSMLLFAASRVFRDSSETSSGDKLVHLTDPDFETATVVRAVLDLVLKYQYQPLKGDKQGTVLDVPPLVVRVACFLHKYDCGLELLRLEDCVFERFRHYPHYAGFTRDWFIVGALANNVAACTAAINSTAVNIVPHPNHSKPGGNCHYDDAPLIPGNMSKAVKATVPRHYLAALALGWDSSGPGRSRAVWAAQFKLNLKP